MGIIQTGVIVLTIIQFGILNITSNYMPYKKQLNIHLKPENTKSVDSVAIYNSAGEYVFGMKPHWHSKKKDFTLSLIDLEVNEIHSVEVFKNKIPLSVYVVNKIDKGKYGLLLIKYRIN
jgi:hypothetical protein